MQMIDLMKRLAELDAGNPNVVYEDPANKDMAENMPSSVIRSKQRRANMSDEEFAKEFANKSDEELMRMAWQDGYGKGSRRYVVKKERGQAATNGQDVAEGTDDNLRLAVLDVLQTIYKGASSGEDMIDYVSDELGDYFSSVKHSKDQSLRKAYQLMRDQGADAEGNPLEMAKIAKQAMDMLTPQDMAEGLEKRKRGQSKQQDKVGEAVRAMIPTVDKDSPLGGQVRHSLPVNQMDRDMLAKTIKTARKTGNIDDNGHYNVDPKDIETPYAAPDRFSQAVVKKGSLDIEPGLPNPGMRGNPDSKGQFKKPGVSSTFVNKGQAYPSHVGVKEGLDECGMMGMGASSPMPHTPASINMTAASGEELSAMLKDIMTLAGQSHMHDQEPLGGADGVAVVDVEPAGDGMGPPEMGATDSMRSVLDRMNDIDSMDDDDEEDDESVSEWDNTPDPETTGYGANVPSGNDMHKEKHQYPAAQRGDNAMAATYESLMAEYKKFIAEEHASK